MFSPCSHGPDRFPKQIVKLEFVKKKFTVFVLLYDFVYAMHAPVVIQYKYYSTRFSPGTLCTKNKTDRRDIFEILLKEVLNAIAITL